MMVIAGINIVKRAEDYLKEAGMEVKLFEGIESDPSVETVMKGAQVMTEFEPDWIVAIGGGSPIDAAKAIYAVLVQNIALEDDIIMAIWSCVGYTVLLCFTLFKTGSLAKSVFQAH